MSLVFGTAGIRALMGTGAHCINSLIIKAATFALAQVLKEKNTALIKVAISYDSRHNSKEFAEAAAQVLSAQGIHVYLTEALRPTPFLAFLCRHYHCQGGIMITASHNPPEYNGFKVYGPDGGQIVAPTDTAIRQAFNAIDDPSKIPTYPLLAPITSVGEDADLLFLEVIKKTARLPAQNKKYGARLSLIYTSLHGTGITLAEKAFKSWGFTHFHTLEEQCEISGDFPTVQSPNPENPKTLELGIEKMLQTQADLLIATDPDADRMAAVINVAGKAYILSGNQIAALLLNHLLTAASFPKNSAVISTVVTSRRLKALCEKAAVAYFDTLTGFKYIAEKMCTFENTQSHTFLFGAEQSYGYLAGNYIHDKDGIGAFCLLSEVALHAKLKGKTLLDVLHEIDTSCGIYRESEKSIAFDESTAGHEKMRAFLDKWRNSPPKALGGLPVIKMIDYANSADIALKTDMLAFHLEGGHTLIIRPSGTEAKVKLYAMATGKNAEHYLMSMLQGF